MSTVYLTCPARLTLNHCSALKEQKLHKATLISKNATSTVTLLSSDTLPNTSTACATRRMIKKTCAEDKENFWSFRAKVDPSCHRFAPGRSSGNAPLSNPQIHPSTENRHVSRAIDPRAKWNCWPAAHIKAPVPEDTAFYPAVCDGSSRTLVAAGTTFYSTEHLQEKILLNNRPCDQIWQKEGKPFPPFSVTTQQQLL